MNNTSTSITIADCAEVNPPVALNCLTPNSPVSFIPMADVAEGGGWVGRQIRQLKSVRVGYTPFLDGDLLFAKITPCMENGKGAHVTGLINGVGFGSTEFHVLRARPGNNARFLYHWLQAKPTRQRAIAFMGGSAGQQRVQADFFRHYQIPRMDQAEQRLIAAVLDVADEAIAKTAAVIAKLKQVRSGLTHDLLTCGLDDNGEVRDPIKHPEEFVHSPVGKIPLEWRMTPAQTVCYEIVKGTTPPSLSEVEKPHWVPFLRVQNLTFDGSLSFAQDRSFLAPSVHQHDLRRSRVFPGDVLMNLVGPPMGKVSVVPDTYPEWNVNQAIAVFRTCDPSLHKYLALFLLSSPVFAWFRKQAKRTSGQMNLTLEMCRTLPVACPAHTSERDAIVKCVEAVRDQIASEENWMGKLLNMKSGLMSDLLSGRVPVPETIAMEPAG